MPIALQVDKPMSMRQMLALGHVLYARITVPFGSSTVAGFVVAFSPCGSATSCRMS
jgi:hypothetical protein